MKKTVYYKVKNLFVLRCDLRLHSRRCLFQTKLTRPQSIEIAKGIASFFGQCD